MLTTSIIGSYAWPSWYFSAVESIKQGKFGPKDIAETLDDAVDTAVRDQEDAGVDVISDGEMRRIGFFTAGFYGRLSGLQEVQPGRKLGPAGHDQREKYEPAERFEAPEGLGLVEEFTYVRQRTIHSIKVPCPGPFTLAGRIETGTVYKNRMEAAEDFSRIINSELKKLVKQGVEFIQLDEPSYAVHPDDPTAFVELFNQTVDGVNARIGLHLCFGNFVGRPVAHRTYDPLFPHILETKTDELALEFANREHAELELIKEIVNSGKTAAVGLVDVKNYFVEPPELVADRVRKALNYASPEKLVITPDCGLSQTARWAARAKLHSMVEGTRIVKNELK